MFVSANSLFGNKILILYVVPAQTPRVCDNTSRGRGLLVMCPKSQVHCFQHVVAGLGCELTPPSVEGRLFHGPRPFGWTQTTHCVCGTDMGPVASDSGGICMHMGMTGLQSKQKSYGSNTRKVIAYVMIVFGATT